MAWKAKENILWFKKGDEVETIQDNWKPHFEEIISVPTTASTTTETKVEEPPKLEKKKPFSFKKKKRGKSSFQDDLEAINGIGPKTVEDVMRVFPTETSIREAVKEKEEMPFRDDVVKLLNKKFK